MPPSVAAQQRFHAPWRHGRRSWFSPHGVPGTHLDLPVPQALRLRSDSRWDRSRTAPVSAPVPAAGPSPVAPSAAPAACCVPGAVPAALSGPGPSGSVPGAPARSTPSARASTLLCRVPGQPGSTSGPGTGTGLGSALYQPAQARPLGVVFDHPRRGLCPLTTAPSLRWIPALPQQVSCTLQRGVSRGSATAGSPPGISVIPRGSACIRPPRTGPIVAACWPVHGHTETSVRPVRDHKVASRRPENSLIGPQRSWWPPCGPSLARICPVQGQNQPRSGRRPTSGHSVANVGPIVAPCWPAVLCLGPLLATYRPLLAT